MKLLPIFCEAGGQFYWRKCNSWWWELSVPHPAHDKLTQSLRKITRVKVLINFQTYWPDNQDILKLTSKEELRRCATLSLSPVSTSPLSGSEKITILRATAARMKTITNTASIIPFLLLSSSGLVNSWTRFLSYKCTGTQDTYTCFSWTKARSRFVKFSISKFTFYPEKRKHYKQLTTIRQYLDTCEQLWQ